jgi:N utilization substance protein A
MKSDLVLAVTQLANERNLPMDMIMSSVEDALASAYKRDPAMAGQEIIVRIDPNAGEFSVFAAKSVVSSVDDPNTQITLTEARTIIPNAELEELVEIPIEVPSSTGRIAAQTAKQVILQRLRDAEREKVYEEYLEKEGEIVTCQIQRFESNRYIIVDINQIEAVLPPYEQIPFERLRPHQRLKVYVSEVRRTAKGPEIIVSRTNKNLLKRLLEIEVPEINNGTVEIKSIAREPGHRSKVAVVALQEGVDAVGSCVGIRGSRIQNIVKELQDEKIDVIQWHDDPAIFIANALSPAQVLRVELDADNSEALVVVPERHLSLAIGREGQNARLAARVSGWKIDIKSDVELQSNQNEPSAPVQDSMEAVVVNDISEVALEATGTENSIPTTAATVETEELTPLTNTGENTLTSEITSATSEVGTQIREDIDPEAEFLLQEASDEPEDNLTNTDDTPPVWNDQFAQGMWETTSDQKNTSGIRFAEDILGPRYGKSKTEGKRGKGRNNTADPKKGKRARKGPDQQTNPVST